MSKNKQTRIQKRKKNTRKKRLLFFLIPFLALLVAGTYWFIHIFSTAESVLEQSYEDDGREKSELREEVVNPKIDNVSILIMGVDENDHRDNKGQSRTDALVLATVNIEETSVKLLSIPRDSLVYIPERGYEDKINHAHYFGGVPSTIETVERLLEIPVDYWVKLNFNAFVDVIDALDGIEVEVPYEFRESDSMDRRDAIHLLPGYQKLNGEEALALARTRKHDNDVQRGKRQLEIVKAVLHKTISLQSILKIDDVIEAVGDNLTTNMTFSEIKSFLAHGTKFRNLTVDSYTLAGTDYWPEKIYYWLIDEEELEETKLMLKRHLGLLPNENAANLATENTENEYEIEN